MKQPTTQENNPERPPALAEARGSASPRDWHWSLRSMEIHAGRLCVECGERVPADGPMCEECEIEMMYD